MTGFVTAVASAPSGTWVGTHFSAGGSEPWGTVCLGKLGLPSSFSIRVRAADAAVDLGSKAWLDVSDCVSFCDKQVAGQYLQVEVTVQRGPIGSPVPALQDVSIQCCSDCETFVAPPDAEFVHHSFSGKCGCLEFA